MNAVSSKKISNEFKIGVLVIITIGIILLFTWMIGASNPFSNRVHFYLHYNFAGGIETGSPVRLAGIKVGKVEKIEFVKAQASDQNTAEAGEKLTPLRMQIGITKEAADLIHKDSKFFINLAGLIGERYIEITPGTINAPQLAEGEELRGIDPPRIDQLISQSFDLAGKVKEILDKNQHEITNTIKLMSDLSHNMNVTLTSLEKSKLLKINMEKVPVLLNNLIAMTEDLKVLVSKTRHSDVENDLLLVRKLLRRLEGVDKPALQKFLQKEGIRASLFSTAPSKEKDKE